MAAWVQQAKAAAWYSALLARQRVLPDLLVWIGEAKPTPSKEEWDEMRRQHEELVRCERER